MNLNDVRNLNEANQLWRSFLKNDIRRNLTERHRAGVHYYLQQYNPTKRRIEVKVLRKRNFAIQNLYTVIGNMLNLPNATSGGSNLNLNFVNNCEINLASSLQASNTYQLQIANKNGNSHAVTFQGQLGSDTTTPSTSTMASLTSPLTANLSAYATTVDYTETNIQCNTVLNPFGSNTAQTVGEMGLVYGEPASGTSSSNAVALITRIAAGDGNFTPVTINETLYTNFNQVITL